MTSMHELQSQTVSVKEPLHGEHKEVALRRFGGGARFTGGRRTVTLPLADALSDNVSSDFFCFFRAALRKALCYLR